MSECVIEKENHDHRLSGSASDGSAGQYDGIVELSVAKCRTEGSRALGSK